LPLNEDEVRHYIAHRLSVADGDISMFAPATIKAVFQITAGIPRVINLLCDRALTLSFTKQSAVVPKYLFVAAANQILGEDVVAQRIQLPHKWLLIATLIVTTVIGFLIGSGMNGGSYGG